MNTALFKQATPSLEQVLNDWFKAHPGILDSNEGVKIIIKTEERCPVSVVVDVDGMSFTHPLDDALSQSVNALTEFLPRSFYRVRIVNGLLGSNITTIRQLVQKDEAEMLKYRNFGRKCIRHTKEALKEIDSRLYLGMKLLD